MGDVNKQLLEALAQLDLAETEIINTKAWSAGEQAKAHCDFALTAIATARQAIAAAEQAQQGEPVGELRIMGGVITGYSYPGAAKYPEGTKLYASHPPAVAVPDGYVLVPVELLKSVIADDSSWHSMGYAEPGKYGAHAVDLECLLAAEQDAARYRWLLANYARGDGWQAIDDALSDGEADTSLSPAIDAAMK